MGNIYLISLNISEYKYCYLTCIFTNKNRSTHKSKPANAMLKAEKNSINKSTCFIG